MSDAVSLEVLHQRLMLLIVGLFVANQNDQIPDIKITPSPKKLSPSGQSEKTKYPITIAANN